MVNTVFAQKKGMRQVWTEDGKRIVVTKLSVGGNTVVRGVASPEEEKRYQLAFGDKKLKNVPKPTRSQLEKAGVQGGKRVLFETHSAEEIQPGTQITVESVIAPGDVLKVSGRMKGRGFAGVVKRHAFAGGPRTHGQSDRERAPGSIGQRTTPGRVFPGMRMAGHYGNTTSTLETVKVVAVDSVNQVVWVNGTLPGAFNSILSLTKRSTGKTIEINEASRSILGLTAPVAEVQAEAEVTPTQEAAQE